MNLPRNTTPSQPDCFRDAFNKSATIDIKMVCQLDYKMISFDVTYFIEDRYRSKLRV